MFRRFDPQFAERAEEWGGGIVVAGHNYGQGSSREQAAFAALHLGDGMSPTGERLLREDSLAAMREPLAVVPSGIGGFASRWGLGWSIHEWSGREVVGHDGGTIGQPLEVAPWGDAFGMLVDRFGVSWLVNIGGAAA